MDFLNIVAKATNTRVGNYLGRVVEQAIKPRNAANFLTGAASALVGAAIKSHYERKTFEQNANKIEDMHNKGIPVGGMVKDFLK